MSAAADGSRNGSISEPFSGHTTKSGCGSVPASMAAASASVCSTWLSRTTRSSDMASMPVPGVPPCTTATVAVDPSPPTVSGRGITMIATMTAAETSATGRKRRRRIPSTVSTASATTRKVTPAMPAIPVSAPSGELPCEKAISPHGKPPIGMRPRSASMTTHADGTHSTEPRSRLSGATSAPRAAFHKAQ